MSYLKVKALADEGKVNEAYELQCRMLGAKLDPRLVADRSQSGQTLSYIEAHVAIQILNHVLGYGNWDMQVTKFNEVMREKYENKSGKEMMRVGYMAEGTLTVRFINGTEAKFSDTGYGSSITSTSFGDAVEGASKELRFV